MYRIGVDVGGTNTDAAILDITASETPARGVLASSKTPTTPDVTSGIKDVVQSVLQKSAIDPQAILSVAIGTTHFVNAVVEADARRLSRVAVVRLCGSFSQQIPPFTDFPPALRKIVEGQTYYLDGGLEIDGREIATLNPRQVREATERITASGITQVALVGIFSPLDHNGIHEEACKKIMLEVDPSLSVVCSHTIGGVGMLERENATILNASILPLARKTVRAFVQAMSDLNLACTLYLTQNDGTLTDAYTASELPIKTFASGPTNSLTGAAFLASLDRKDPRSNAERQILVVDIGGTTSDICALLPSGFPRQASNFVEVGGVRTMFSMPEVLSIGLGGGSIVRQNGPHVSVGPDSVGHYLTSKAKVFGGDTLTTTDIVVAAGKEQIGDVSKVADIAQQTVTDARKAITKLLNRGIESMKVSSLPVTVLLVGGGSIVYMDSLEGVEECVIPPHHDSANAVGAAIAKVAGTVDVIEILEGKDEKQVLKQVEEAAIEMAVQRGADRDTIKIAEVEKLPLQYVTNKATRIMIKAVGKLRVPTPEEAKLARAKLPVYTNGVNGVNGNGVNGHKPEGDKAAASEETSRSGVKHSIYVDIPSYKPEVENGVWYLSALDLEFITSGTGVLGTGGGGPSYQQYLIALECLRKNPKRRMRVTKVDSMGDSDVCVFASWYGAPSVASERIPQGTELCKSVDVSIKMSKYDRFHAIIPDEIGGGNGMVTFPTAVYYDIPTLDGDLMGRAYPTIEHGTPYVYGEPISPCVLADAKGNVSAVLSAESNKRIEKMLRTTCVELGLFTSVSAAPLTGNAIKRYAVPNTMSQAWYLGRAIHMARREKIDVIEAIFKTTPGRLLYTGKIIDVHRDVSRGYTMGYCVLAPLSSEEVADSYDNSASTTSASAEAEPHLIIPFQNEYLYAAHVTNLDKPEDPLSQEVICTVPDLISILDKDGEAVGSQELKYGLRVRVIGMAAHPLWTGDERGLAVGGPKGFGLDMEWKSIGKYQQPPSVIDEFNMVV